MSVPVRSSTPTTSVSSSRREAPRAAATAPAAVSAFTLYDWPSVTPTPCGGGARMASGSKVECRERRAREASGSGRQARQRQDGEQRARRFREQAMRAGQGCPGGSDHARRALRQRPASQAPRQNRLACLRACRAEAPASAPRVRAGRRRAPIGAMTGMAPQATRSCRSAGRMCVGSPTRPRSAFCLAPDSSVTQCSRRVAPIRPEAWPVRLCAGDDRSGGAGAQ